MATEYQIPITYVVSASVITPGTGLEPLKLSTILLLTDEQPLQSQPQAYTIARTAGAAANTYGTDAEVTALVQTIYSQQPNILANNGYVITASFLNTDETYTQAIQRLAGQIYFEAILTTRDITSEEAIAASNAVQSMNNRILALPITDISVLAKAAGVDAASVDNANVDSTGGELAAITSNYNTRFLLYSIGADDTEKKLNAKKFAAAYLSRGLAVNYSGSNTTLTMNLKDLTGIVADTNISETVLQQCADLGADCFPSIEGLAKVISNKQGNQYFDQAANRIWLVNAIQRAVFNTLATTGTKIPQTEPGITQITNAIREVCNQAVTNGMLAPGTWNSPDTFGNYDDFIRNIEEFGFYIYHQPISEQAQSERDERKAPVTQVACKEAGAYHSGNILIYIES